MCAHQIVAKKLQLLHDSEDRNVKVGKVDGSAEKALSSRFSVRGYPSFYLIDGWTVRQYEDQRSVEALVKFATRDYKEVEVSQSQYSPF